MRDPGFDPIMLRTDLEVWCRANCASLANEDSAGIARMLATHRLEHAFPWSYDPEGTRMGGGRCDAHPCRLAGVAFTMAELERFELEARGLAVAALMRCEDWARRLAKVDARQSGLVLAHAEMVRRFELHSPAFRVGDTGGRPEQPLAKAIAQHLRFGGFTYREIAAFMDCSEDAARKRCAGKDWRTIVPWETNGATGTFRRGAPGAGAST